MKWKALPPMPKPDSHIEFAWVIVNNSLVIVGGTTDKHPITKRMVLVGEVFQFNLVTLVRNSFLHPLIVVMYDARRTSYNSFQIPNLCLEPKRKNNNNNNTIQLCRTQN